MIISASTDHRAAAKRRLPPFLFHYADGGAYAQYTLGCAFVYALTAGGEVGAANLLDLIDKEIRVAMTLTAARTIAQIKPELRVGAWGPAYGHNPSRFDILQR